MRFWTTLLSDAKTKLSDTKYLRTKDKFDGTHCLISVQAIVNEGFFAT